MRRRLDREIVRRGLVETRTQAEVAIEEGRVLVSGAIALKPARLVGPGEPIELTVPARFVSRGGHKLDGALERFGLDVTGSRCLDAGASTGGFTDCLLQRGAREVVAVDVGRDQLHERLRADRRVHVFEGVNLRHLDPQTVGGPVDFVTADLSFISLRTVAPALAQALRPGAEGVLLVKPQFEAGRAQVGRGGIVRDPAVHRSVLIDVLVALDGAGLAPQAVAPSPIRGGSGNVEFVVHVRRDGVRGVRDEDIDAAVEEAATGGDSTSGARS